MDTVDYLLKIKTQLEQEINAVQQSLLPKRRALEGVKTALDYLRGQSVTEETEVTDSVPVNAEVLTPHAAVISEAVKPAKRKYHTYDHEKIQEFILDFTSQSQNARFKLKKLVAELRKVGLLEWDDRASLQAIRDCLSYMELFQVVYPGNGAASNAEWKVKS